MSCTTETVSHFEVLSANQAYTVLKILFKRNVERCVPSSSRFTTVIWDTIAWHEGLGVALSHSLWFQRASRLWSKIINHSYNAQPIHITPYQCRGMKKICVRRGFFPSFFSEACLALPQGCALSLPPAFLLLTVLGGWCAWKSKELIELIACCYAYSLSDRHTHTTAVREQQASSICDTALKMI